MSKEMAFHSYQMERSSLYFEGWYHWFHCAQGIFAVIFAISKAEPVTEYLIQVYDSFTHQSKTINFASATISDEPFSIKMGENELSERGLFLHLDDLQIDLQFHDFQKLNHSLYAPTIMGPLAYAKKLQCVHAIISMRHYADGWLQFDGQRMRCYGQGYMEKDWGSVFPSSYLWCMGQDSDRSFVLAIADVPVWKTKFQGMFAVIHTGQEEVRFASYYGAYVHHHQYQNTHKIAAHQGNWHLYAKIIPGETGKLKAPAEGGMNAWIEESIELSILLRVMHHKTLIFEQFFDHGAFEYRQKDQSQNNSQSIA